MQDFDLQPHLIGEIVELRRLRPEHWAELYQRDGTETKMLSGRPVEHVRFRIRRQDWQSPRSGRQNTAHGASRGTE